MLHMRIYKRLGVEDDDVEKLVLQKQKQFVHQQINLMIPFVMQMKLKLRHRQKKI